MLMCSSACAHRYWPQVTEGVQGVNHGAVVCRLCARNGKLNNFAGEGYKYTPASESVLAVTDGCNMCLVSELRGLLSWTVARRLKHLMSRASRCSSKADFMCQLSSFQHTEKSLFPFV